MIFNLNYLIYFNYQYFLQFHIQHFNIQNYLHHSKSPLIFNLLIQYQNNHLQYFNYLNYLNYSNSHSSLKHLYYHLMMNALTPPIIILNLHYKTHHFIDYPNPFHNINLLKFFNNSLHLLHHNFIIILLFLRVLQNLYPYLIEYLQQYFDHLPILVILEKNHFINGFCYLINYFILNHPINIHHSIIFHLKNQNFHLLIFHNHPIKYFILDLIRYFNIHQHLH